MEKSFISNIQCRKLIDRILIGEDGIVDVYIRDFSRKDEF